MRKHSVVQIFANLSKVMFLNTFLIAIIATFIWEQNFSYKKIDNLDEQRALIASLKGISKDNVELATIKFNNVSSMLLIKIDQLRQLYQFDFVGKYIIYSEDEYMRDLDQLEKITKDFNAVAKEYYTQDHTNDKSNKQKLHKAFMMLNAQLDRLYIKNVKYNQQKSAIITKLAFAMLLLSIISTYIFRKRLKLVLDDILYLSSIQPTVKNYQTHTLEADAIILRMRKKVDETIDKNLLDPVTDLLNHKGLVAMYSKKKNIKSDHFTAIVVYEIDNFSKTNTKLPQEITQAVLKKVAYTLSLFEQPTDVIARTDYNQFTMIISRQTKEQCIKESEMIRQSLSELKFKLPDGSYENVSMSGGIYLKPTNKVLEDAITQAKQILAVAKEKGGNFLAQMSDLTKLEL